MSFYYFESPNINIVYQEGFKLFVFNNLNNQVYFHPQLLPFFFCNTYIKKNNFFFHSEKSNTHFLSNQLCIMLFGIKKRFRLTGRGYYMYNKGHVLYFKLGFSHVVRGVLSMDVHVNNKIKKRKFWYMSGFSNKLVNSFVDSIRSLRGPHLYSKRVKGIYVENEFIPRGVFSFNKF